MNAPKRKVQCVHLSHVTQVIKDRTGPDEHYLDSHFECMKTKCHISKRACINCIMYQPLNGLSYD